MYDVAVGDSISALENIMYMSCPQSARVAVSMPGKDGKSGGTCIRSAMNHYIRTINKSQTQLHQIIVLKTLARSKHIQTHQVAAV